VALIKRIKTWILMRGAQYGAQEAARRIPAELASMARRYEDNVAILAGIEMLREILDPERRSAETDQALHMLCDAIRKGADDSPGKLDDAAALIMSGSLNCLPERD
jgi:hypothetical protein